MQEPLSSPRTRYAVTDFLYYTATGLVPVLTGAVAIHSRSVLGLLVYALVCLGGAGVILYYFCTHCPHYQREGRTVQCMFFWGLPKPFAARPGPLRLMEKLATAAASVVVMVFPLAWLADDPGLLLIYLLSLGVFLATVWRCECHRCIHRDCPVNRAGTDAGGESAAG